jgi:hypothetical protein
VSHIANISFWLSDDDEKAVEEAGTFPPEVVAAVRAAGWDHLTVSVIRQYGQVSYEAFRGIGNGVAHYGAEPHRAMVEQALRRAIQEMGA